MTNDDLRNKIIAVLDERFGQTQRFNPADLANRPCTTVFKGFDERFTARSLSFGEVADAALEAFESWGDDAK